MRFSLIIPVYNRPAEVDELLQSAAAQSFKDFEAIIVEDGSAVRCDHIVAKYGGTLDVHYFEKDNSGPGQTRNYGAERARGEYLIILDSDVILPTGYLRHIDDELRREPADAFGGPDRAHDSFTPTQKAINYAMTSFFTTGGIRGGRKKLDKFYPRSFNMGIRADVYRRLGGFSKMRFGEDIDFSIRIFKNGCSCRLFPEAWVWHKRRANFRQFFKQVHNSGIARINLYKKYPDSLKAVHLLPAVFTLGVGVLAAALLVGVLGVVFQWFGACAAALLIGIPAALFALFALLIFADSSLRNKSLRIGALSVAAASIQLIGYGSGFLRAAWQRLVLRRDEFSAFSRSFYK